MTDQRPLPPYVGCTDGGCVFGHPGGMRAERAEAEAQRRNEPAVTGAWEEADLRHANGCVADYYAVVETYAYSPQIEAMFRTEDEAVAWIKADNEANERPSESDHYCVVLAREGPGGKLFVWNSYEPAPEDGP